MKTKSPINRYSGLTVENQLFASNPLKGATIQSFGEGGTYRATGRLCVHWLCWGRIYQRSRAGILPRGVGSLRGGERQG